MPQSLAGPASASAAGAVAEPAAPAVPGAPASGAAGTPSGAPGATPPVPPSAPPGVPHGITARSGQGPLGGIDPARIRAALGSVRRAAAKARPAPEPGTPESTRRPAPSSLTDVVPRRTLIIAVAVLVLAILGTVIGIAVANSGGGDGGSDKPGSKPTPSAAGTTPSAAGTGATGGDGKNGTAGKKDDATSPDDDKTSGHGKGSGKNSADDSAPSSSGPNSGPGKGDAAAPGSSASLPAGWHWATSTRFHFAIGLPAGWRQTGTTEGGSGAIFSANGGYPRVQVDFTSSPGEDAAATWRQNEPYVRSSSTDYHLIGIHAIQWRGYPTVADWDFLRTQSGGTKVHVKNRGFVVDGSHGYAIMASIPVGSWDSPAMTALRNGFYATFRVVG